jgi:hypothetical protein
MLQLNHAFFEQNSGCGFVAKPKQLRDDPPCWPPPRDELFRATLRILSLHQLPAYQERRPRPSRGMEFEPELTGKERPPVPGPVSNPKLAVELHSIGGFSCVSRKLPPEEGATGQASSEQVDGNGFNAVFDETFHCLAAEPRETILRIAVWDHGRMVAYETAVLSTLRGGYRSLQLRDHHGTKIELCFVAVRVDLGSVPHWSAASKRELFAQITDQRRIIEELREQLASQAFPQCGSPVATASVISSGAAQRSSTMSGRRTAAGPRASAVP